jgi:hypothetical protein
MPSSYIFRSKGSSPEHSLLQVDLFFRLKCKRNKTWAIIKYDAIKKSTVEIKKTINIINSILFGSGAETADKTEGPFWISIKPKRNRSPIVIHRLWLPTVQ